MGLQFGAPVADNETYEKVLKRREDILAELQRLQNELRDVDSFVTLYERLFRNAVTKPALTGNEDTEGSKGAKRQRNILPPARLAEMCRDILIEHGRPMTRSELLEVIQAKGIPLAGNDPSKNLGTILWRNSAMFTNVPGRGYWVADRPLPD